ncbi:MAG: biotin synthase BioB, partial [Rikenellaceae bacterium]
PARKLTLAEMPNLKAIYTTLKENVKIELCASMGLLNREEMTELWSCGVRRYHCNIETSASYFPMLCSTHTMEEKLQTIRHAKALGMDVCSGGIIGMGETMRDRIEMAHLLRSEGVYSIPLNVLNPIDGTPLEGSTPLSADEVLRTFAMFRIMNPEARIRFAGGRKLIAEIQEELMHSGADAAIVGDMLTTVGSAIDQDMKLFARLGFNTK